MKGEEIKGCREFAGEIELCIEAGKTKLAMLFGVERDGTGDSDFREGESVKGDGNLSKRGRGDGSLGVCVREELAE